MSESKEKLSDYIKKEIIQSGFPLEITVATILDKHKWQVVPHLIYNNSEKSDKYQELDIHATKTMTSHKSKNIKSILAIECKKQETKPWVFFQQEKPNTNVFTLNMSPLNIYYHWVETHFFHKHYYFNKKPCSYHLPCYVRHRTKKGDEENTDIPPKNESEQGGGDVILKAINQALDGLMYSWFMETERYEKLKVKHISFIYPIIVFDGKLFSATVHSSGEIETTESKFLQLKVSRAFTELTTFNYSPQSRRGFTIKDYIPKI